MDENGYDYREIDDVIHGRVRLAVMAYLSGADAADFNELKAKVGGTDGNLSVHLRKLEDAGYVNVRKTFKDRKPRTIDEWLHWSSMPSNPPSAQCSATRA